MTREWSFPLPYDRPPLTLNGRLNRWRRAELTRELKDYGTIYTRKHKIPALDRYTFELHWAPRVRRGRDDDNPAPTVKPIVDGYCRAVGVADVRGRYVLSPVVIHDPTGLPGRLWVVVRDLGATQ